MSDCIFCKIVAGEIPATKVFENDDLIAFNDIAPKADTHILVIPKQHIVNLKEATEEDAALMQRILMTIPKIAEQEGLPGFRLIMNNGEAAGQEVFHMHWHILHGGRLPGF